MKVGLLGGTFDPPHIGHLVVAIHVKAAFGLDEVRLVVANHPWQKEGTRTITSSEERLAMTTKAVEASGVEGISVSDIEIRIGGPSYMVTTLERLQIEESESDFLPIIGADAASELHTWHESERLREIAHFVVVNRPGYPSPDMSGWRHETVEVPPMDLSSSDIRELVENGKPLAFLTPRLVIQHIEALGLYRLG